MYYDVYTHSTSAALRTLFQNNPPYLNAINLSNYNDILFVYINNMQFSVNKMYQQYDGHINDLKQHMS